MIGILATRTVSHWRTDYVQSLGDCLFYNFVYYEDFPFPQISLDTKEQVEISLETQGIEAPNTCSAVIIAGNFLDDVDNVMMFMKNVTKQTKSVPFAVFLLKPWYKEPVKFSNELRLRYRIPSLFLTIFTLEMTFLLQW